MKRCRNITSLDMYTSLCSEDVVFADGCADESVGIYPCYYYRRDGGLYLSTSVVSLIKHKGVFNLNRNFKPQRWRLSEKSGHKGRVWLDRLLGCFIERNRVVCNWYHTHETIDKEIFKMRPRESITFDANTVAPIPRGDFISNDAFIEKTAFYINKFINGIENEFPDYNHVVLTGGKDSQLILLAPKVNDSRWNVFSAEPNAPIVKDWISDNGILINRIYEHDCKNEETGADLSEKILAGDLYSNPRHMRWLPTLKSIGAEVGEKCFFWAGTSGDTLMVFNKGYHRGSLNDFYALQLTKSASWQGNTLQVHKNFTGFACLSPYYSKEIWDNVFFRYDYEGLSAGSDFRRKIGEALAGRAIIWPDSYPPPPPLYVYEKNVNIYRHYVRCIQAALSPKA
jgi:hypothetical protein